MKEHPYIGKSGQGNNYLVASSNLIYSFISKSWMTSYNDGFAPMENITREYLANTYGEVVSPEHAELIIELAELHGFEFDRVNLELEDAKSFMIYEDSFDTYPFNAEKLSNSKGRKKITIPLPPKADKEEHSSKPIKIGDEVETNLGLGHIRLMPDVNDNYIVLINGHHIPVNTVNVKKLEAPKQELSELPRVGDEVVAVHENNSLKGKLLALTKKYAIISQGCGEQHLHLSAWTLEKTKTPEEELRDELESEIKSMITFTNYNPRKIAEWIIGGEIEGLSYEIKKKPQ